MVDKLSDTLNCLPDCMMPDGADPCNGYKRVNDLCVKLEAERDVLSEQNFAMNQTIAGYRNALEKVHDELMNLQPHIPQACKPGHESFIDSHVDEAMKGIDQALSPVSACCLTKED